MSQEDAIRQLLEQGTYEGDYDWEPFSYDVLGSVPGVGYEENEWDIYQEILKRSGLKNVTSKNITALVNTLFPDFPKWSEDLKIADQNARTLYMGSQQDPTDPYVSQAKEAYPQLNKLVWDTVDKVSKAVKAISKKDLPLLTSGKTDNLYETVWDNASNTYIKVPSKLSKEYSSIAQNLPEVKDVNSLLKSTSPSQYNELATYLQQTYDPYEPSKYDWYEPESWFPKAVMTAITAATAGGMSGAIGGTPASIGGTGASAGGWAETIAPYTGMTGATSASTTAAPWWSTLGTTLGTAGTQGGTMDFADLLSRVVGQNIETGGFDWGALTGQSAALGSSPLDLFTSGFTEGGFGNMSNVLDLITSLGTEGGGGGGNIWQDIGKRVLNQILGGGGDGGGQPTGTQQSSDWLNKLLQLVTTGGAGYLSGEQQEDYQNWIERLYQPQMDYQKAQLGLFKDVFEPSSRELGGYLSSELTKPFSLTPELEESIWGKAKERVGEVYKTQEQTATERFAGSGMLGQGPAQQYFNDLGLQKIKSLEDVAVEQSIWEYGQKYKEKQDKYSNILSFIGRTPQVQSYGTPPYAGQMTDWSKLAGLFNPTPKMNFGF